MGAEGECIEQSQAAGRAGAEQVEGKRRVTEAEAWQAQAVWGSGPWTRVWLLVLITWEPLGAAQSEEMVPETCLSSDTDFKFRGSHTTKVESFAGMTQNSLKAMKLIAHYRDRHRLTSARRGWAGDGEQRTRVMFPGLSV